MIFFNGFLNWKNIIITIAIIFIPQFSYSNSPVDYNIIWQSWDNKAQLTYLLGLSDGIQRGRTITLNSLTPNWLSELSNPKIKQAVTQDFLLLSLYEIDKVIKIRDIITNLYQDPANSYIPPLEMAFIAQDKLQGRDIQARLREERKKAIEMQDMLDTMRQEQSSGKIK